jgi:hypothetical protein
MSERTINQDKKLNRMTNQSQTSELMLTFQTTPPTQTQEESNKKTKTQRPFHTHY